MAQLIWAGLSLSELIPVKLKPLNFQDLGVSKTSDHIQIKVKMPNPSQEHPASSNTPNQDLKDIDNLDFPNQDKEP